MITTTTVYRTMGQQFDTFEKAIQHREDLIDGFMMKCPGFYDIPLKSRTAFIQHIIDHRPELIDLLNYDDKPQEDD